MSTPTSTKSFSDSMESKDKGCILTEHMIFGGFSAGYTTRAAQQLFSEFRTPEDWLSYSPDLNPLDFAIWRILQAKVVVMPHANLGAPHLSIATEWDLIAAEYICKACCSFHHCRYTVSKKIKFKLPLDGQPTAQFTPLVLFRATISFNVT
jgi:hypothetical protein